LTETLAKSIKKTTAAETVIFFIPIPNYVLNIQIIDLNHYKIISNQCTSPCRFASSPLLAKERGQRGEVISLIK